MDIEKRKLWWWFYPKGSKKADVRYQEFYIKRRSKFHLLLRIPKMWVKQWKLLKGVAYNIRISFLWESTCIVMRSYNQKYN